MNAKNILAASFLIIALSVAYYFVVFLPGQEREKLDLLKQAQATEEKKKVDNETQLHGCLIVAQSNYGSTWASDCVTNSERVKAGYASCLSSGLGKDYCLSIWGKVDSSSTCALPNAMAIQLNQTFKDDKDQCYKNYPTN